MSWQDEATTIVEGRGEVTDKFDFAVFAVSIEGKGKTGKAAKESIQPKITELVSVVGMFTDNAKIDKLISFFTTIPYTDYDNDRKPISGYCTTFSLRFEVRELLMVNEVHDAITDLDVRAYSPMFMVDSAHRETMNEEAFKKAFQHALDQLRNQKHTITDVSKTFSNHLCKIVGWEVLPANSDSDFNYSKNAVTLGGRSESSPQLIIEGKAKVSVSIRVGFKFEKPRDD